MDKEKLALTSGVILVDKPKGISSHGVVSKLRKIFNIKKIGHFGTLDPFATGLLVAGINEGTKLSQFLVHDDKEYVAEIKFGENRDTYDCEGKITEKFLVKDLNEKTISSALNSMTGKIMQIPPVYSAIKVKGKPLYKYSREGIEMRPEPREVFISKIDMLDFNGIDTLKLKIECSKGTYIRSIAYDLGKVLKVGAYLYSLVRTRSGSFKLDEAHSLDFLHDFKEKNKLVLPLTKALPEYCAYYADDEKESIVRCGKKIKLSSLTKKNSGKREFIRILGKNNLIAIGSEIKEIHSGEEFSYFKSARVFH